MMGKRISKTSAEIADSVKYNITNRLQHRKCVTLEMSINTYLEVQSKENHTKDEINNLLKDIIINKLQVAVTKNTQTGGTNGKND